MSQASNVYPLGAIVENAVRERTAELEAERDELKAEVEWLSSVLKKNFPHFDKAHEEWKKSQTGGGE